MGLIRDLNGRKDLLLSGVGKREMTFRFLAFVAGGW